MPADEKQTQRPQKPQEGEAAAAAAAEKAAKKETSPLTKKLIMGGVILGVILAEAVVAYMLVQMTKQEDPRELAEKQAKEQEAVTRMKETTIGMTSAPIEVVVNIPGEKGQERFAKVAIVLEFDNIKYPELGEQLVLRTPKIKNVLIEALSVTPVTELSSAQGKRKLREDLVREVNRTLSKEMGSVREVFISEFIIQ